MKKKVIAAVFALCVATQSVFAQSADFEIKDGVLVKYKGSAAEVVVPEGVTSIGEKAFYQNTSLKSVTLPEGVTSIGGAAFSGCESLSSITFPASLASIGTSAFWGCFSLRSIILPASLTSIGGAAFKGCENLSSITFPANLVTIGEEAFSDCENLSSVIFPAGLTTIGEWAFWNCKSLSSITLPAGLISIGLGAFFYCDSLAVFLVDKANTVYADRDGALFNKAFTELIQYPKRKTASSYTVPEGVTAIRRSAFTDCESLNSVTLPESLATIEEGAFNGCNNLSSITLPASLTGIGESAFSLCNNLTAIRVDKANRVYADQDGVLFNKSFTELIRYPEGKILTNYAVPEGVTAIREYAFMQCNLSSITLPAGVAGIGTAAFNRCSKLSSITIQTIKPPALGGVLWSEIFPPPATIYVPAASVDTYKNAAGWKNYSGRIQAAQ